ncbi:MAG: TMEM43 family protein, partial [Firmicutes bacterium]|nr:TMEM43 family protein [Bacillota bacterium]
MAYVERTSQSWLSRIVGSFVGVLIGIVLFIAAFPVLFINEKWSIDRIRDLRDAESQLVSVEAGAVDPGNEGKLVHLNGEAITEEILKFADFGIEENAIRLRRDVEMYQWQEHKDTEKRKKLGGGEETVTTYTYSKTWADRAINSSGFKEAGHDNPSSLPFSNDTLDAKDVLVGSYQLSATMIDQYDRFTPLPLGNDAITKLDGQIRGDYDGRLHVRD